jgi:hypothetical protein
MFPAGGVMLAGVGGGVTLSKASASGADVPNNNATATAGMQAPIIFERLNVRFGCNLLQFMFILLIDVCGIRARSSDCSPES